MARTYVNFDHKFGELNLMGFTQDDIVLAANFFSSPAIISLRQQFSP